MDNDKFVPADVSLPELIDDIDAQGPLTQDFNTHTAQSSIEIMDEYRVRFDEYLEHANHLINNKQNAQDTVQTVFLQCIQNPDLLPQNQDIRYTLKIKILEHIEEMRKKEKPPAILPYEQIIGTDKYTKEEIKHLKSLQKGLATIMTDLEPDDLKILIEFMKYPDDTQIPDYLKAYLSDNDELRDLYLGDNKPDNNEPS